MVTRSYFSSGLSEKRDLKKKKKKKKKKDAVSGRWYIDVVIVLCFGVEYLCCLNLMYVFT